ncbi:MAG TPA: excinuclease ABC subunit UvrA [Bacteroidota bacterium]|nr:excinuclease ABC subunit UvrA [Bacteroidota bacterium]
MKTLRKSPRKKSAARPRGGSSAPRPKAPIVIRGARVHNLRNVSLELPRNRLIVFTGVSGSGKSSLAFDTIYAEGQRRFVESLTAYARQFLERMDKPDVDFIQGISPAIAIEQKATAKNPRSTVGTSTEIYDYLRLLFARIGRTVCPTCTRPVHRDTVASVIEKLEELAAKNGPVKFHILCPLAPHPSASLKQEIDYLKKKGFIRVMVGKEAVDLSTSPLPARARKSDVRIVIDRLVYRPGGADTRTGDSVETAFNQGDGYASVVLHETGEEFHFNRHFECSTCRVRFEEPDPRLFSFNNPYGACPECQGFGKSVGIDMDLVVPDKEKSLRDGAIHPWTTPKWHDNLRGLLRIAYEQKIRIDVPWRELTVRETDIIINGSKGFEGLNDFFKKVGRKAYKIYYRIFLSRYRGYTLCAACAGTRLRPAALNVRIRDRNIPEIVSLTIDEAHRFFGRLKLTAYELSVARRILEEVNRRLEYLVDVGLGYLTLDRLAGTLSGGETQRINLATALGSSLVGSLYVLDEPSIGLHQRDTRKLISILESLRDVGNTVIVVEHDAEIIAAADHVVDLGPGAGEQGGAIVAAGSVRDIGLAADSLTGKYLSGALSIAVPRRRTVSGAKRIVLAGARENNLKSVDLSVPVGRFTAVTGVSGSGKSTLVHDCFYAALRREKGDYSLQAGKYRELTGAELVDAVELVDQAPIGRTPRSNPATYTKVFDLVRELFASTQAARVRGFTPGSFSFNIPGGRCETCEGSGIQTIEMQFLADIELPCESCKGKRFRSEVLDAHYHGKSIDDVLGMTVTQAMAFFSATPQGKKIVSRLRVLSDVGMGYVRLGQSSTTLSGGEAQRIKLASHLANTRPGSRTLFIFDEPTTGLHFHDIAKLLAALNALVERGNTVLVIEHHPDVIKCADWVIDLGPEAGQKGGRVVAEGTPEEIAAVGASHTGKFLKALLGMRE